MLALVPSLSLSAMVSTSTTGKALLNGRAAGSLATPDVASFLRRTSVQMAVADAAVAEATSIEADPMFFDESKAIAELGFPISEEELLRKAKAYLYYGQGTKRPELLAPDFVFMGPFVGGADGPPHMRNGGTRLSQCCASRGLNSLHRRTSLSAAASGFLC